MFIADYRFTMEDQRAVTFWVDTAVPNCPVQTELSSPPTTPCIFGFILITVTITRVSLLTGPQLNPAAEAIFKRITDQYLHLVIREFIPPTGIAIGMSLLLLGRESRFTSST